MFTLGQKVFLTTDIGKIADPLIVEGCHADLTGSWLKVSLPDGKRVVVHASVVLTEAEFFSESLGRWRETE